MASLFQRSSKIIFTGIQLFRMLVVLPGHVRGMIVMGPATCCVAEVKQVKTSSCCAGSPLFSRAVTDCFSRRYSRVLTTDADGRSDPITGNASIVDLGYGVNSTQHARGMMNDTSGGRDFGGQPMQGVPNDTTAAAARTDYPVHKMTDFSQPKVAHITRGT